MSPGQAPPGPRVWLSCAHVRRAENSQFSNVKYTVTSRIALCHMASQPKRDMPSQPKRDMPSQ